MTTTLSTFPNDIIAQLISEFHKPTLQSIPDEITSKPGYQGAILELGKLHEIVRFHPPEVALLMLKELNIPNNTTELLIKYSLKSKHSNYSYAWRLDQSVPNVQAILLNIINKTTSEIKTMRMDLSTFHKLRYNVSLLIKEHAALEKRVYK